MKNCLFSSHFHPVWNFVIQPQCVQCWPRQRRRLPTMQNSSTQVQLLSFHSFPHLGQNVHSSSWDPRANSEEPSDRQKTATTSLAVFRLPCFCQRLSHLEGILQGDLLWIGRPQELLQQRGGPQSQPRSKTSVGGWQEENQEPFWPSLHLSHSS